MAGAMKRTPDFTTDEAEYWRFMKLSKADWADAYADLYRQVFGELSPAGSILFDAEHRTELLKDYRKHATAEAFGNDGGPDYPGRMHRAK